LASHKDLLRQVVSINREGVKSTLPETMDLPPSLQPYLFVREQAADIIASNVKVAAEVILIKCRKYSRLYVWIIGNSLFFTTKSKIWMKNHSVPWHLSIFLRKYKF
jgi:hypothetical protein